MRLSYRPELPPEPQSYRTQVLDHLGLVAGMFEELGITEVIDQATQQDPEMRIVTAGHAVKAMVLNGLGFLNQQLYLVPHFFQNKPLSRLIAPGIQARHLNDDTLGRALDTLYDTGLTELYSLIAATAATRLGLTPAFTHLDTTSFHVDGRYNSAEVPDDQVVHITQGYSRDHRPDLNQVMLELLVEHQAGIPVLMKPLSGNSSDAQEFGQVIKDHIAHLHTAYGSTYLVADSALYSADNLQKLAETQMKWITRVPATLGEAQAVLAQAAPQTMAPLREGYRFRVVPSAYGGVAQRWVLLYSEPRQPQAQRTVNTQWRKQSDQEVRAFKRLCRTAFACEADAQQALTRFAAGLQTTVLHASTVCPTPHYGKRGRPGPGAQPAQLVYHITGGPGVSAHGASGTRRPAELFYPRDERTGRGAVICPSGARRLQRPSPGRTRVSLPQRPAIFGLVAVSEKTRTGHGPVDGHDGLFARLCGVRVSHPPRAQGA